MNKFVVAAFALGLSVSAVAAPKWERVQLVQDRELFLDWNDHSVTGNLAYTYLLENFTTPRSLPGVNQFQSVLTRYAFDCDSREYVVTHLQYMDQGMGKGKVALSKKAPNRKIESAPREGLLNAVRFVACRKVGFTTPGAELSLKQEL